MRLHFYHRHNRFFKAVADNFISPLFINDAVLLAEKGQFRSNASVNNLFLYLQAGCFVFKQRHNLVMVVSFQQSHLRIVGKIIFRALGQAFQNMLVIAVSHKVIVVYL